MRSRRKMENSNDNKAATLRTRRRPMLVQQEVCDGTEKQMAMEAWDAAIAELYRSLREQKAKCRKP